MTFSTFQMLSGTKILTEMNIVYEYMILRIGWLMEINYYKALNSKII